MFVFVFLVDYLVPYKEDVSERKAVMTSEFVEAYEGDKDTGNENLKLGFKDHL